MLESASRLAERGLPVGILTLAVNSEIVSPYPLVKFFVIRGHLPSSFLHWITYPTLMRQVDQVIFESKAKVIFPQVFPANYWGFLHKKRNHSIPCVWYCHEPSAFIHNCNIIRGLKGAIKCAALFSNPLFQVIDRYLVQYADKILVNSEFTATRVHKIYQRESKVVYPGIDVDEYKPNAEKDDFIFAIGRLTDFKRIDLILQALIVIKKMNGKRVRLLIGGDGEAKDDLVKLTHLLKLDQQVVFLGLLSDSDVKAYMGRARAIIFPTSGEPFGLVPLEAMACGTPVIVSNSGGPKEVVKNNEVGLLFTPGDKNDLASKICSLIENRDIGTQMGMAARNYVAENYSWEKTIDGIYDALVEYL